MFNTNLEFRRSSSSAAAGLSRKCTPHGTGTKMDVWLWSHCVLELQHTCVHYGSNAT